MFFSVGCEVACVEAAVVLGHDAAKAVEYEEQAISNGDSSRGPQTAWLIDNGVYNLTFEMEVVVQKMGGQD